MDDDYLQSVRLYRRNGSSIPHSNVRCLVYPLYCDPHRYGGSFRLPSRFASPLGESTSIYLTYDAKDVLMHCLIMIKVESNGKHFGGAGHPFTPLTFDSMEDDI